MADNVTFQTTATATPPDATAVAADDVGGVHYQVVKLDVGGDGVSAPVGNANPVPVSDAGGALTVDGAVTANAGTNLNTSLLALEAGGNLAAAATSLAVVDDWDESDRAKVNPIVGQAGVQGGSGAVSDTTQRVVLATDVALPAGDNNIGNVDIVSLPTATVQGGAAHASPVAGNPNLIAGRASNAIPTDVGADGDAASMWTNRHGAQVITLAPHVGLNGDPWSLVHEGAQYTSQQTSTILVDAGAGDKIVVTQIQIQSFGTTGFDIQVYFGTGAFSRGTSRAVFDGGFKPSATLAPGVAMNGPFISGSNGDDLRVTTSAAGSVTVNVWYYAVT